MYLSLHHPDALHFTELMSEPVYTTAEIRTIEQLALSQTKPGYLMEKAGLAAAQIIRDQVLKGPHRSILILAGPGNNGGDAFVVARYLKEWGNKIIMVFATQPERQPHDAAQARQAWLAIGGDIAPDIPNGGQNWDAIVDGLFGIGLDSSRHRDIEDPYRRWIDAVNPMRVPVVALDIPSGLGSDNGCIYGTAIRASLTVTFIGLKAGLYTNFGPECCGRIILCHLDITPTSATKPHIWLLDQPHALSLLPPRRSANSHKGSYGNVAILGGSNGMIGAALLSGRAALHLGAGRVYLGLLSDQAPAVDLVQPELMLRPPTDLFALQPLDCLIVGPGLGQSEPALSLLDQALSSTSTIVLDADALNLIARHAQLKKKLVQRSAATILTPHPAEAARLLSTDTAAVQHDRMTAAFQIAQQFHCHVVLKGAGSICCFPDGSHYLNTSGNPGLSTAGTGDVLTGMIGALLAQGLNANQALSLAVFLHGVAADRWVSRHDGPVGMTASEIIPEARAVLNQWIYREA